MTTAGHDYEVLAWPAEAPDAWQHVVQDQHEILKEIDRLHKETGRQFAAMAAALTAARQEIGELTAKVGQLEQEFGPLARKFSGTAARLAAGKAATFVRRNHDRSD
jgi:hypothetical protein